MERFSTAPHTVRLKGVLDPGSLRPASPFNSTTSLITAQGCVHGQPVWIAATDPSRSRGAIGLAEAEALCAMFRLARREPHAIVLLIDSAGAKVDEGLAALGAFRRLFREVLLTRLTGVPLVALLGKSCFGGASMLASACNARVYSKETLFAVSGPGVIEALRGKCELDAADAEQVRTLMGGEARVGLGTDEHLTMDSIAAFRECAARLIDEVAQTVDVRAEQIKLGERLTRRAEHVANVDAATNLALRRMEQVLPPGYAPVAFGPVCLAWPSTGSTRPAFLGLLNGGTVGAYACWHLSEALLRLHGSNPKSAVVLLLDAVGHAASREDESLMLSAYLTHLSLTAHWLTQCGHEMSLWIPGAAAGAVFVAFAAPVNHVAALRSASIRILPELAVRQILRAPAAQRDKCDVMVDEGVVDAFLDRRLESYTAITE